MNPLDRHPRARRVAYYTQFVVAGVLLLTGVAYGAMEDVAVPGWYVVTLAVANAAWSYLGLTAGANVDTGGAHRADGPPQ